jgi:hypothetical protein
LLAHPRIAPVGADDEIGVDLEGWTPAAHVDTADAAGALQQLGHLRVHQKREPRQRAACSATKSRNSHWGMNAMNRQCVGR